MLLTLDNFDGFGARDYTSALDAGSVVELERRLNQPSQLRATLIADTPQFVVPASGARVIVSRADGSKLFTGYLNEAPAYEYLGWGERGPAYRYRLRAMGDEFLLDRKQLPARSAFVARPAGEILRQLADDLLPGAFNDAAVQDLDPLPAFSSDSERTFSEHAADLALRARAAYRAHDGALVFAPLGAASHSLSETDAGFSPDGLKLRAPQRIVNDLTVTGRIEPRAHVKDYFLGDGFTLGFGLSDIPFTRLNSTFFEEEYEGSALDPARWTLADPATHISVSGGKLLVAGGNGSDGQTRVVFVEKIELGGGMLLQHGETEFTAASNGVLGGLYNGSVAIANCLAGFRITPSGGQSGIQALVNGAVTGSTLTTVAGHRYGLSTRLYATEIYRTQQTFHSSAHPAGSGLGGAAVAAGARVVLEVHDIDPASPGSPGFTSTVLYDAVVASVPGYCTYAPVNSASLHCNLAFTRVLRISDAEVRSQIPTESWRTRLVGLQSEGAECLVIESPEILLLFHSQYPPVANEAIEVRYRSRGRALARITDPASIAALASGADDGVRSVVRRVATPSPRTTADCENAALALLSDSTQAAWMGEYVCWSDALLAAGGDVFPGDAIAVSVPSRGANFSAIVREVQIALAASLGERERYLIQFSNEAAAPLAFAFEAAHLREPLDLTATTSTAGTEFIADLPNAEVTSITSTTVDIDAGAAPPSGGGIEVRRSDFGWGQENDRNLVGRFTTQTFTVARLSRIADFCLRQYDASSPPKYSRYSTALHVDYPL
jgi:hypothetical protein